MLLHSMKVISCDLFLKFQQNEDKYVVVCVQEPVALKYKEEPAVNNEFPMPLAMRPITVSQSTQDENSKNV